MYSGRIATIAFAVIVMVASAVTTDLARAQGPAVTKVVAIAKPRQYDGPCPASIEFIGTIFVSHPTQVSFRWERSDRGTGPVETIFIRSAGEGVRTTWQLRRRPGEVFRGSETLHVLAPGDFFSNPAEFTLVCR